MAKHAPDLMEPAFFAQKVDLHHKQRSGLNLKIKGAHPLVVIHGKLQQYHGLHKAQLQTRHPLLDEISRLCYRYSRGKNPTKTASEKVQTVTILGWQANRRLQVEQARSKELEQRINAQPNLGLKVRGGFNDGMRFERVAKSGGIAVTGADLYTAAQGGKLGPIELTGNDANDFYALKKLLKTMTQEQLRLAGLRQLEYSSDTQREEYAVEITATKFKWERTGQRINTLDHTSGETHGHAHYACDVNGNIYARKVAKEEMGRFAHSSFLAGENVLCAGTIVVNNGRLLEITNESGHYQPKAKDLGAACAAIITEGYDPDDDGYAMFTDFTFELNPPARSGRYRVPLALFALHNGTPPNHGDFEVNRQPDGRHVYADLGAAQARGCEEEDPGLRTETNANQCLENYNGCIGPQYLPTRSVGYICTFCANYARTSRVLRMEAIRIGKVRTLLNTPNVTTGQAHKQMANLTEQMIVDLLFEAGIDKGPPARCAFLTCGSLARGESVTYSDIDAVLVTENDVANTSTFYETVIMNMNNTIGISKMGETGFRFCPGGLSPMDTINNDGLRGTPDRIFHLIDTFKAQNINDPSASAHLDGALHTKLIFGEANLAQAYQQACQERLSQSVRDIKANAIHEIRGFVTKMKTGDWKIPKQNDLFIKIKDQVYRPVHMIVHSLALYYGVNATASRDQIRGLIAKGKMSRQVGDLLTELLDTAGRLRMEVQLEQGQEFEVVKLRHRRTVDPQPDKDLVNGLNVAGNPRKDEILRTIPKLKILLGISEEFTAAKSRNRNRSTPFKTATPNVYSV